METTKDSIDWSHVHERFKWMARDSDGRSFFYEEKPEPSNVLWATAEGWTCLSSIFASYKCGTCDWRDSLVERPKASEE